MEAAMPLASIRLRDDPQLKKAFENNPPLIKGNEGKGVAIIQELLADLGEKNFQKTLAKREADGIFGSETFAAVQAFQRRKGLKTDGIVGKATLIALDLEVLADYRLERHDVGKSATMSYW
jgi:peptidoglycan hydrolase-like protein with peptidoglycan-binding domain